MISAQGDAPLPFARAAERRRLHAVGELQESRFHELLTPEARRRLREWGTLRSYPAGRAIFHRFDVPDTVFVLLQGHAKLVSCAVGREVLLRICAAGDVLGVPAALEPRPEEATALAIDDVQALAVSVPAFSAFLAERPEAALLLVRVLGQQLADSERRRIAFATKDTLGRLADLLLELTEHFGGEAPCATRIDLPVSQEELAGCIGASHRAVASALQKLRQLDCVETGRRAIDVLDAQRLREIGGS